jgi:hypothetical protein
MAPIDWDDQTDRVQVSIDIEKLSIGDEFTIEGKNVTLLSIFDEVDHFKNCNLAAWELKYCLDNDKSRFDWAADYGRGVIYYMKDECGNECPYDFKNIMFEIGFDKDGYATTKDSEVVSHDYIYTFTCKVNNSNSYYFVDASIFCNNGALQGQVIGNVMAPHYINGNQQALNGNVFYDNKELSANNNTFELYCTKNIIGNNCNSNTFGKGCTRNNIGRNSEYNEFKGYNYNIITNDCNRCSFGISCYNISMNNYCNDNVFNSGCNNILIKHSSHHNIFGVGCMNSVIGEDCCNNEFGEYCTDITLDGDCCYNIFGHYCREIYMVDCSGNQFGHDCRDIWLDAECNDNTFGLGCKDNTFEHYCYNNRIGDGCIEVYLEKECYYNNIGKQCDNVYISEYSCYNNIGDRCDDIYFVEADYFYVNVLANTRGEAITGIEPDAPYPQVCGYDENDNYIAKPMLSNVSSTGGSAKTKSNTKTKKAKSVTKNKKESKTIKTKRFNVNQ